MANPAAILGAFDGALGIDLFHESRKTCLCGHQKRHHLGSNCTVCSCDRFCSSLPHPIGPEGDTELLTGLT